MPLAIFISDDYTNLYLLRSLLAGASSPPPRILFPRRRQIAMMCLYQETFFSSLRLGGDGETLSGALPSRGSFSLRPASERVSKCRHMRSEDCRGVVGLPSRHLPNGSTNLINGPGDGKAKIENPFFVVLPSIQHARSAEREREKEKVPAKPCSGSPNEWLSHKVYLQ
jgi:hypothetical protein